MPETILARALEAAAAVELERQAGEETRADQLRHDATQAAGAAVAAWLRSNHLTHESWTLGTPEEQAVYLRYRVPVTFSAPNPDDDLSLLLELDLSNPEHLNWWRRSVCARCHQPYDTPAGWDLASLGARLSEHRLHECERRKPPVVVEAWGLGLEVRGTRSQHRVAELEDQGYEVEILPAGGGAETRVILVGRMAAPVDLADPNAPF